jgi:hypothetical protein
MAVTRSNGTQTGGAAPLTLLVNIGKTITDVTNASIFANNRDSAALATWPEPIMGVRLTATSTTQYEFWLSNTGDSRGYRTEVVEWPTAQRELTQDYYQIYANSDTLKPTSGWPVGSPTPLGENTAMTGFNQPMNTGDVARIRMSLKVSGSSGVPQGDTYFLQYANRASSTCSAISTWSDVGSAASTTALWRGFTNPSVTNQTPLSTDPPTGGGLVLSVSDRAATYESNGGQSTTTPYAAVSGDDIEFDWVVQDSLAASRASYCFRMVRSDKTPLTAYNFYPTLKTIGYGVESKKWRWYDDAQNATPTTTLAAETVTPINISYNNAIALRLTLRESQGATGSNIKFKLQYSESPTFSVVSDVVATTTCTDGVSLWCYAELGGTDNTTIASSTLSDADSCIAGVGRGCGMYNTSPLSSSTLSQQATSSAEFSFTIRNAGARVNRTYYFRAWDMQNNEAVAAASGESYPSLTTEGSSLNFAVSGIATSTVVGGVAMDVATTPTSIPFGSFTGSSTKNAAYQLSVDTDATQGYQVFVYQTQNLLSSNGGTILPVTGTNAVPGGWATVCPTSQASCFGYHTIDATLAGGSARFAPNDTYAALTTTPGEVAQYSAPITGDAVTVVYRVTTRTSQSSGAFSTSLVYLVVPVF